MKRTSKTISIVMSLFFSSIALLTGCSSSAYVCPLKDLPGGCRSQMDVYQATLSHDATKDSIFMES